MVLAYNHCSTVKYVVAYIRLPIVVQWHDPYFFRILPCLVKIILLHFYIVPGVWMKLNWVGKYRWLGFFRIQDGRQDGRHIHCGSILEYNFCSILGAVER